MVEDRGLAHQALDRALHLRQVEEPRKGAPRCIGLCQRGSCRHLRDGIGGQGVAIELSDLQPGVRRRDLSRLGHELLVDVIRHNPVKPQEPPGDKAGHLGCGQKGKGGHPATSTSCSKKNSYFR